MLVDQFEEMLEQSEEHPLVFALSLHGFIVGQPFRLRPLRKAIKHCVEHKQKDRVWFTRAGEIADILLQAASRHHSGELVATAEHPGCVIGSSRRRVRGERPSGKDQRQNAHLRATPETSHWGFLDAKLKPVLIVKSGDRVVIDTVSGNPEMMPPPNLRNASPPRADRNSPESPERAPVITCSPVRSTSKARSPVTCSR